MYPFATSIILVFVCFMPSAMLAAEEPDDSQLNVIEVFVDLDTQVGETYNFWNVYPVTV